MKHPLVLLAMVGGVLLWSWIIATLIIEVFS